MHKWQIIREAGTLQLLRTDISNGQRVCCGHGPERDGMLAEMLQLIAAPGNCQPMDVVCLPSGEVLVFALHQGQA